MARRKRNVLPQVPPQPPVEEQSGSAGRRTDPKANGHDKDTGQDRHGQSGFSGAEPDATKH